MYPIWLMASDLYDVLKREKHQNKIIQWKLYKPNARHIEFRWMSSEPFAHDRVAAWKFTIHV